MKPALESTPATFGPDALGGRKPRQGDLLELRLDALDERGDGVGAWGPFRVSVRGGLPGARLVARVLRRRRDRVQAARVETLEPGDAQVEPRCALFGTCGGCTVQHLDYAAQLDWLERVATVRLRGLPGGDALAIEPIVGCADAWAWRNKMDFTFGSRRYVLPEEPDGAPADFALGLHVPGRHEKVLDVASCAIQPEGGDAVLASVRRLARELGLEPWDLRTHTGLLRHLIVRRGVATGELLVGLVTSEDAPERVDPFAERLIAERPEITTLVQLVNERAATVAVGQRERVLHGTGRIHEVVRGLRFAISAGSFFQTNSRQAERLFAAVREEAGEPGRGVVFDLYCGTGAIGLQLAAGAREVWGFEQTPSAVEDAERNAALNGIANVRFVQGDVALTTAPEALAARGVPAPDLAVVDPPRAGLHPRMLATLARLDPRRIVYVSCNLAAAARDCEALAAVGWRAVRARPVDMFPHTPHLECVLTLERRA